MQGAPGSDDIVLTRRRAAGLQPRLDERTLLLSKVRDHRCERSFERLYQYYAPRICAFLRQKGAPDRISQEIMQDVMTSVWEKARQFDPESANASTWIFTIARNRYIDLVRKERRSVIDANDPLLVRAQEPEVEEKLCRQDKAKALHAAIASLPEQQSEVLKLIYLTGMKQQVVADRLNIPLNTVKSRLRLALEKLRAEMGK